jgi:hypothetical protein
MSSQDHDLYPYDGQARLRSTKTPQIGGTRPPSHPEIMSKLRKTQCPFIATLLFTATCDPGALAQTD